MIRAVCTTATDKSALFQHKANVHCSNKHVLRNRHSHVARLLRANVGGCGQPVCAWWATAASRDSMTTAWLERGMTIGVSCQHAALSWPTRRCAVDKLDLIFALTACWVGCVDSLAIMQRC